MICTVRVNFGFVVVVAVIIVTYRYCFSGVCACVSLRVCVSVCPCKHWQNDQKLRMLTGIIVKPAVTLFRRHFTFTVDPGSYFRSVDNKILFVTWKLLVIFDAILRGIVCWFYKLNISIGTFGRNGCLFSPYQLISPNSVALAANYVKVIENRPILSAQMCPKVSSFFCNILRYYWEWVHWWEMLPLKSENSTFTAISATAELLSTWAPWRQAGVRHC